MRHGRACPGHPRLASLTCESLRSGLSPRETRGMPATRPGVTGMGHGAERRLCSEARRRSVRVEGLELEVASYVDGEAQSVGMRPVANDVPHEQLRAVEPEDAAVAIAVVGIVLIDAGLHDLPGGVREDLRRFVVGLEHEPAPLTRIAGWRGDHGALAQGTGAAVHQEDQKLP